METKAKTEKQVIPWMKPQAVNSDHFLRKLNPIKMCNLKAVIFSLNIFVFLARSTKILPDDSKGWVGGTFVLKKKKRPKSLHRIQLQSEFICGELLWGWTCDCRIKNSS